MSYSAAESLSVVVNGRHEEVMVLLSESPCGGLQVRPADRRKIVRYKVKGVFLILRSGVWSLSVVSVGVSCGVMDTARDRLIS